MKMNKYKITKVIMDILMFICSVSTGWIAMSVYQSGNTTLAIMIPLVYLLALAGSNISFYLSVKIATDD